MAAYPFIQTKSAGILWVQDRLCPEALGPEAEIYRDKLSGLSDLLDVPFAIIKPNACEDALLIGDEFTGQISALGRRSLVLAGGLLESAITQVALISLLDGFDVYVCADLCLCADKGYRDIFLNRIRDCGGFIITARQIAYDVVFQDTDRASRSLLLEQLRGSCGG